MTNTSIELINYAVDVQAEQSMKFLFLVIVSLYTILALWYFNNNEPDLFIFYVFKRLNQVFAFAWFTFLPLYIGLMYRTVPFTVFLIPMIGVYGILFPLAVSLFMFGYGEKLLRWLIKFIGKEEWVKFKRSKE